MQSATALKSDLDCLLDLNRDYIRSVQDSDVSRFQEILANDFLCSLPDGSLLDREAFLKHTAVPVKISNLEAHDVNVRILGPRPWPLHRRLGPPQRPLARRLRSRHPLLTTRTRCIP